MNKKTFRVVSELEFNAFVASYPRKLVGNVAAMYEPPLLTLNDFEIAAKWPESVVAKIIKWSDGYPNPDGSTRPDEHFIIDDRDGLALREI